MSVSVRAEFEPVRRVAFGDIGAGYTGIGTKVSNPVRILIIQNTTDVELNLSTSGVIENLDLPAGVLLVLDLVANKSLGEDFCFEKEKRFYVKHMGVAPTIGGISLSVIYGAV